jgi:hypothetical protein
MKKRKALHSNDESSTATTPRIKVSQKYKNITAADNARLINGNVYGDVHFHTYSNSISMSI